MNRPVYSLTDIEGLKVAITQHKEYIMATAMTKSQLNNYLSNVRDDYYAKCTPIGYL